MLHGWAPDTYSGVAVAIMAFIALVLSIVNTYIEYRSRRPVPLIELRTRRAQAMTLDADILRNVSAGNADIAGHSMCEMDQGIDTGRTTFTAGQVSAFLYRFGFPVETDIRMGDYIRANERLFCVVSVPIPSEVQVAVDLQAVEVHDPPVFGTVNLL